MLTELYVAAQLGHPVIQDLLISYRARFGVKISLLQGVLVKMAGDSFTRLVTFCYFYCRSDRKEAVAQGSSLLRDILNFGERIVEIPLFSTTYLDYPP